MGLEFRVRIYTRQVPQLESIGLPATWNTLQQHSLHFMFHVIFHLLRQDC